MRGRTKAVGRHRAPFVLVSRVSPDGVSDCVSLKSPRGGPHFGHGNMTDALWTALWRRAFVRGRSGPPRRLCGDAASRFTAAVYAMETWPAPLMHGARHLSRLCYMSVCPRVCLTDARLSRMSRVCHTFVKSLQRVRSVSDS